MENPIRHSPLAIRIFHQEESSVLSGPGDDLLSRVLRQSTIGAEAFDGRVRDGIGSDRLAESHQAGKGRSEAGRMASGEWGKERSFSLSIRHSPLAIRHSQNWSFVRRVVGCRRALANESDQVERAISTGKLNALLRLHARPIDVVVFHGSSRENWF